MSVHIRMYINSALTACGVEGGSIGLKHYFEGAEKKGTVHLHLQSLELCPTCVANIEKLWKNTLAGKRAKHE